MKEKYIEDLKGIREIMDRSSRFVSLSGLSGVAAGIIALLGAYYVYKQIYVELPDLGYNAVAISGTDFWHLIVSAIVIFGLALIVGLYFTWQKAKKTGQRMWDRQAKRTLLNLLIPLLTGGFLCLILLDKGFIGLIAPLTLIFYGLALVNTSKYTLHELRSLGLLEIALGLAATHFIGYGLLFWAIGFGVLHIIYGTMMYFKYGS